MPDAPSDSLLRRMKKLRNTLLQKLRIDPATRRALEASFDPVFYLSSHGDVANSGLDPLEHYLVFGWREGRRPNGWFEPERYLDENPEVRATAVNPFVHFLERQLSGSAPVEGRGDAAALDRMLYWMGNSVPGLKRPRPSGLRGRPPSRRDLERVRPHFDASHYLEQVPSLAASGVDPLLHYMTEGWVRGLDPSARFSTALYLRHNPGVVQKGVNPLLHFVMKGCEAGAGGMPSVQDARILAHFETDPDMQARIRAARDLDPMVGFPETRREVSRPGDRLQPLADVLVRLRAQFAEQNFRYVVAISRARMSGATRVAALFSEALCQVRDPSDILVVLTDGSESSHVGWFPEGVRILDLAGLMGGLAQTDRSKVLIDLMRGVGARTLVNINSRVAWEALSVYGRQISQEFRVATYLFTWDESPWGDRSGYPIEWLRATSAFHHVLMTDAKYLAGDLADRMGFGRIEGEAPVVPLYCPAPVAVAQARRPAPDEPVRVLWAGRFDRQKRLDILVKIAAANPQMVFDVYGQAILDERGLEAFDLPENIVRKDAFTDLADVFREPYHAFLYTSQWDGLPTVLLDMAAYGIPIVAPDVGGISELVDDSTGWLVADFEDVAGYSAALNEISGDPEEADRRTDLMNQRLVEWFSNDRYWRDVEKLLADHDM